MPRPWERREDENDNQWAAFKAYLGIPKNERSLKRLLEHFKEWDNPPAVSPQTLHTWSTRKDWAKRVKFYETEVASVEEQAASLAIVNITGVSQGPTVSANHEARKQALVSETLKKREEFLAELEELRSNTKDGSKAQARLANEIYKRLINEWLPEQDFSNLSVNEATKLLTAVSQMHMISTKLWNESLGIEALMQAINVDKIPTTMD